MLACALSLGLAFVIAGCSSGDAEGGSQGAGGDDAAARPTPTEIAEPTEVPAPNDASDDADDAASDEFDPAEITDLGAREGASGEARQDDAGYWYYQVVSGDVASVICDRFDRRWWQLETIDGEPGFDCRSTIYPGQVVVPTAYGEDHDNDTPWVPSANPFAE